jgi:hypothetical protein
LGNLSISEYWGGHNLILLFQKVLELMKSVQLEASNEDDDSHDWAHTEMSLMFFWSSVVDFTFFLITIPKCVVEFSSVFDTKASRVELIGLLAPDARWVKIAGIEFLEVLGAFR